MVGGKIAPRRTSKRSSHRRQVLIGACSQCRFESLESRVLLSVVPAATTTMIDHSAGFANTSDLTLNPGMGGLPNITGPTDTPPNALQLTDGNTGEASSAFGNTPQGIDTFDTTFDWSYGAVDPGADGYTFILQNSPGGATAIGGGGGSLGYQGIPNSIAVKFDIWQNVSTTGVYIAGALPADTPVQPVDPTKAANPGLSIDLTKNPDGSATGFDFHANPTDAYRAHLVYDGTTSTLTETVTDVTKSISLTQKYNVNVAAAVNAHTAFAGFAGATGGVASEQDIVTWKFTGVQQATGLIALPAPTLSASECLPGQIMLGIGGLTGNETGIDVQRSPDGTNFTTITTLNPGTTSYTDMGLDTSKTFSYRVKAVGDNTSNTDSPFSNTVSDSAAGLQPVAINHANGFAGATDLKLNGAKILPGSAPNSLEITDGNGGEANSAFDTNTQFINKFDTTFDFTFGSTVPPAAVGFTFTIQSGPPTATGGAGGGLGFSGLANSVGVKFDLWDNGPMVSTTGVFTNGNVADGNQAIDANTPTMPDTSIDLTMDASGNPTGIDFHANPGDVYRVHLAYDGTTLTETVTDTTLNKSVSQKYTIDIPATIGTPCALVGFTGGTGGAVAVQDILNWSYPTATGPARLSADFNNDGKVNFSDLLILAQNYGKTSGVNQNTGDANADGKVNFSDLLILAQEYGKTSTASTLVSQIAKKRRAK
jgi:hypothetical protein